MAKAEIGKRYRHYKGKEYVVLAIGKHSDTLEEMVVYEGQYKDPEFGKNPTWIRSREMFEGTVDMGGETIDRFAML